MFDEKPQNQYCVQSLLEGRNTFTLKILRIFSSYCKEELMESPRTSHWQLGREKKNIYIHVYYESFTLDTYNEIKTINCNVGVRLFF